MGKVDGDGDEDGRCEDEDFLLAFSSVGLHLQQEAQHGHIKNSS